MLCPSSNIWLYLRVAGQVNRYLALENLDKGRKGDLSMTLLDSF
jgi:hypothetical protein